MFIGGISYGAVTVVYPTGVSPTDVQNIQAAVNQGGSVLLKAVNQAGQAQSFNFGIWPDTGTRPANSSVTLTANVAISGETVGANRTTILNGVVPFYGGPVAVKASITGLKFVNPGGTAVAIWASAGITIQNNEVDGVLPYLGNGTTENLGFFIGGENSAGAINTTISGPVVISGNYIHGIDAGYEFGIETYGVESAMTITGNTIVIGDATDAVAGQDDSEGIWVGYCTGKATVSGNDITLGQGVCYNGIVVRGPQTGAVVIEANQITIGETPYCYAGIGITGSTGTATVAANFIDSESDFASGIYLDGTSSTGTLTGATVSLNAIDIQNSEFAGVEVSGAVTKCSISLNLITGESADGLSASSDGNPADICSSNSFIDNLFLGFTATQATIFLDTNTTKNVVIGPYTTLINNGTGNTVIKGL